VSHGRALAETPEVSQPAPEPEDTGNHVEWRFAWDGAPSYEVWLLTQRLQEGDKLGLVKDFGIVGRLGGSVFFDGGFTSGPGLGNDWDVILRRLRVETYGKISYGFDTRYKISLGAEDGKFYLNDFWMSWAPQTWFERVRLGYIDPPFSMQTLEAMQERSLMESSGPVSAFAPGYRLGLEFRNQLQDPNVAFIYSVSSVGQSQQFTDASDSPFRASLRTVWRPGDWNDAKRETLTHVGLAIGYSFSGEGDVHYRARPESSLMPFLVDTGNISGDAGQVGVEFARRVGPLTFQSEWIGSWVTSKDGGRFFSGAYGELAYLVTGEVRPYDPRSGLFTPMVPNAPFSWQQGHWGSLELAGRLSYTDLTDRSLHGGRMTVMNAGAVWGLNKWVRIHFDGIMAFVKDRPENGTDYIVQTRIELSL
jgi:phosphate-selective porin